MNSVVQQTQLTEDNADNADNADDANYENEYPNKIMNQKIIIKSHLWKY